SIRVKRQRDEILIAISDDGCGFKIADDKDRKAAPQSGGFGLTGTAERVRRLGGKLAIHSAPGEGTKINIIINLKHHAVEH
ncbi:MAG TPA: ATP-binding protein, partial [Blastocatellia bacterium]